ncbi:peptidase [Prevotella melaninogenica]|uniref:peptidase n=1 Tax=Prevotella melaninogenica TaxID=28132 RepID=UPI0028F02FC9|nr:peptidase [Prevotella melaninogenica]
MKRSRLLLIIINYIYHDNIYLMSPIVDWNLLDVLNKNLRNNYERIRPILLKWQENGYIKLIEDNDIAFSFIPEKLPSKEQLIEESLNLK